MARRQSRARRATRQKRRTSVRRAKPRRTARAKRRTSRRRYR